MKIAIFGASSEIAKDLIISYSYNANNVFALFVRDTKSFEDWAKTHKLNNNFKIYDYLDFSNNQDYEVIINFVGVGDPIKAKKIGSDIIQITDKFDNIIIDYIKNHKKTKYIFMSSGAVFSGNFDKPVNENTLKTCTIKPNLIDSYTLAKLNTENKHRSLKNYNIIDLRVFNYFSASQDYNSGFLSSNIVNSIINKQVLKTTPEEIFRDYITPTDFFNLVESIINSGPLNSAIDCYTKSPVSKFHLLTTLEEKFELKYKIIDGKSNQGVGGFKTNYYSINKFAKSLGYEPKFDSLGGMLYEVSKLKSSNLEYISFGSSNHIVEKDLERISQALLLWSDFSNKTIMVTGGGGFIGSYLIKSLLYISEKFDLNIKIICVARKMNSVSIRLFEYLKNPNLQVLLHDFSCPLPLDFPNANYIIHAASQASPKFYGLDPIGTLLPNSVGTMYLLNHSIKSNTERFLFISSGEVYGDPINPEQLVKENDFGYLDPMLLRSCYAESKRMGETMSVGWGHQHKIHTCIVRPFHTYGPGIALNDGRVYADFISDVVNGRDIVLKSKGDAQRAFCYISDAIVAILTVLLVGEKNEAYNIGNPNAEISMSELASCLVNLFPEKDLKVKFEIDDADINYLPSSTQRCCPSIDKIKDLGWDPEIDIQEGFRRTVKSFF